MPVKVLKKGETPEKKRIKAKATIQRNHKNSSIAALSFDDMIDVSEALTMYIRTGRMKAIDLSPRALRYVNNATSKGPLAAERKLRTMNRAIIKENERVNSPTEETRRAYQRIISIKK